MGKSDSYFSSLQCKNTPVSVSALAKLVSELRKLSSSETNERRKFVLWSFTDTLSSEIYRRVAA